MVLRKYRQFSPIETPCRKIQLLALKLLIALSFSLPNNCFKLETFYILLFEYAVFLLMSGYGLLNHYLVLLPTEWLIVFCFVTVELTVKCHKKKQKSVTMHTVANDSAYRIAFSLSEVMFYVSVICIYIV